MGAFCFGEVMQEKNNKKENEKMSTKKNVRKIFPKENKKGEIIEGLVVGSKVFWSGNPDKEKTYKRKEYRNKKFLTLKEAEIFLEVSGTWIGTFTNGEKGFPKLEFVWDGKNPTTLKFNRGVLVKYRNMLERKMMPTKTKPQKK